MSSDRILFLDIDGVLNGHEFNAEAESNSLRPDCVKAFNRILRETEPTVIITSAWRYMVFREVMTWVGFGYMLRTHGVDKRISALLGGTTWPDEEVPTRGQQIDRWIREHDEFWRDHDRRYPRLDGKTNDSPTFVILDDAPDEMCFEPVAQRLVKTDGTRGLTEADADRAIALLMETVSPN